ncbi:hypothetical protein MRX96_008868 [Rhipicephalus microplus]
MLLLTAKAGCHSGIAIVVVMVRQCGRDHHPVGQASDDAQDALVPMQGLDTPWLLRSENPRLCLIRGTTEFLMAAPIQGSPATSRVHGRRPKRRRGLLDDETLLNLGEL